jgi:hypothetical protein
VPDSALFNDGTLSSLVMAYPDRLMTEIRALDRNKVLNGSLTDICDAFVAKYRLEVPRLKTDEIYSLDPQDAQIDVSGDRSRYFRGEGPHHVQGTTFSIVVPFDGDPDLFRLQPSSHYMQVYHGEIQGQTLILRHSRHDHDQAAVNADFTQRLKVIHEYLDRQRVEVDAWNRDLPKKALALLEQRKAKLLEALNVASSLYPLKRRDTPTHTVPVTRKHVSVQLPPTSSTPYRPEPTLDMQRYEDILQMISSLSVMMERSPSAFETMSEEHLRDHVLVILNSNFEGRATGETFNKSGKTDILIREKDGNVFIAECKFWDGPKSLLGAIDQVLGYVTWRDTKLAVIVFNRRKDFSAVLQAIRETVLTHPQCKRRLDYSSPTGSRYLFKQKDDANREMTLTVLAFDVPGGESPPDRGAVSGQEPVPRRNVTRKGKP